MYAEHAFGCSVFAQGSISHSSRTVESYVIRTVRGIVWLIEQLVVKGKGAIAKIYKLMALITTGRKTLLIPAANFRMLKRLVLNQATDPLCSGKTSFCDSLASDS